MLNTILASFYERDLRKMIDEINSFKNEENIWQTHGVIKNSCGNLASHVTGGLNYYIGAILANTGYVRNRNLEFTIKDVPRKEIVAQLEALIQMIRTTLESFDQERMETEFPLEFDNARNSHTYVLTQLLVHLNYHLGQVNYLRRTLE